MRAWHPSIHALARCQVPFVRFRPQRDAVVLHGLRLSKRLDRRRLLHGLRLPQDIGRGSQPRIIHLHALTDPWRSGCELRFENVVAVRQSI